MTETAGQTQRQLLYLGHVALGGAGNAANGMYEFQNCIINWPQSTIVAVLSVQSAADAIPDSQVTAGTIITKWSSHLGAASDALIGNIDNQIEGNVHFTSDGYHLAADSLGIGIGNDVGVIDDIDKDARPLPAGTNPDVGCDEETISTPTATPTATPSPTATPTATPSPTPTPPPPQAGSLGLESFKVSKNYGYMWWAEGWRSTKIFNIQTNRYALSFDNRDLSIAGLTPIADALDEAGAVTQPNSSLFEGGNYRLVCSDSFSARSEGEQLAGRHLDNKLGGDQIIQWIAPESAVLTRHTTSTQWTAYADADYLCMPDSALAAGEAHRLEVLVDCIGGFDPDYPHDGMFAALSILKDRSRPGLWDSHSGLTVRLFNNDTNNTRLDMYYGLGTDKAALWLIWHG